MSRKSRFSILRYYFVWLLIISFDQTKFFLARSHIFRKYYAFKCLCMQLRRCGRRYRFIMFLGYFVFTLWLSNASCVVEFAQVFFRHGQRTSTKLIVFPTDPPEYQNVSIPFEKGELTNEGIRQEYQLGAEWKKKYGWLVQHAYKPSELRVLTGIDNRTVASALVALAAFLPPVGDQIWNEKLLWQPIPVKTDEIIDHVTFGSFDHCPKLKREVEQSMEYEELFEQYRSLTEELSAKMGVQIPNLEILQKMIDAVINRDSVRDYIPFPKWADNPEYILRLKKSLFDIHYKFSQFFLDLMGGWHYDQIAQALENHANKLTNHKIVLYSGHDTNILTIAQFLKINLTEDVLPSFGSHLAIEVHNEFGTRILKLFIQNKLSDNRTEVFSEYCPRPCLFDTVVSLNLTRVSSEEWLLNCKDYATTNCTLYQTLSGILLLAAILLVVGLISLYWTHISYKKRCEPLDSEKQPLLNE